MKKKLPTTILIEVVNHTAHQWMFLPWTGQFVPPDTRSMIRMPVEWKTPEGLPELRHSVIEGT
jgi:hypothetical protein